MKAWSAFFGASFKQTVRNRQNLFWTLFFPIVFMVFIGFLGGAGTTNVSVALIDEDQSQLSTQVVHALADVPVFKVTSEASLADAHHDLEQGDLDAIIVVPKGFGASLAGVMQQPKAIDGAGAGDADANGGTMTDKTMQTPELNVLYGDTNYIQAQTTRSILQSVIEHVGLGMVGATSPIAVSATGVGTRVTTFLDFLVPGLLAMMIMNSAVFAIAMTVTRWRDRGVLKRLRASALNPATIMSTWLVNQSITGIASVVILLLLAVVAFGAHETLLYGTLAVLVILGLLSFFALGFFLASIAKDAEGVAPIVNIVTMPMMFLAGVFFPVDSLPAWLGSVVQYLPLAFLADGLRQTMNAGVGLSSLGVDLLGLAVWLVATGVVAVRFFRWE